MNIAEFKEMLIYAQKMDFDEEPDYEYLENLLLLIKERYKFGHSFEWENPNFGHQMPNENQTGKKKKKCRVVRKIKVLNRENSCQQAKFE